MFLWRASHTTMVSRLEDTRQFNGHLVRTMRGTVSRRLCPLRFRDVCDEQISARTGERCHQSRPAHDSFARKTFNLEPGTWVMYFRRGKVTRGAVGAPSKSGLWLGPGPRPFNNGVGRCIARPGQIGVVWLSHGKKADQVSSYSAPVDAVKERYQLLL